MFLVYIRKGQNMYYFICTIGNDVSFECFAGLPIHCASDRAIQVHSKKKKEKNAPKTSWRKNFKIIINHPMGIISLVRSYGFSAKLTGLRWMRRCNFDRIFNSFQQSQTICFSSQIHASSHQSKTP